MTKTLTTALFAVSLMVASAFTAGEAEAGSGHVSFTTYQPACSIAASRLDYRRALHALERAADDSDFYGERIARNAIRSADEALRTPVAATCEARAGRYIDATRILEKALRRVELRNPKTAPQQFRVNVTAMLRVR